MNKTVLVYTLLACTAAFTLVAVNLFMNTPISNGTANQPAQTKEASPASDANGY